MSLATMLSVQCYLGQSLPPSGLPLGKYLLLMLTPPIKLTLTILTGPVAHVCYNLIPVLIYLNSFRPLQTTSFLSLFKIKCFRRSRNNT